MLGLHSQAVVWQGLRAMGRVWDETGQPALARAAAARARLEAGLRRAVALLAAPARRRLAVRPGPAARPRARLRLADRVAAGSYWNLVMPYALASGSSPREPEADGASGTCSRHGSRLLGLVRAGAYALYGRTAYPASGTDQVYGINVARFLADNDGPTSSCSASTVSSPPAMTPDTFVSGEAASVAPAPGQPLPLDVPAAERGENAAFLETLRSLLVHERRGRDGSPTGLELAYATPRAWLGRAADRRPRAPTSFGPVSYAITRFEDRGTRQGRGPGSRTDPLP